MKDKFLHMWREHRILLVGFLLALAFTVMLLVRTILATVYFANHPDLPIAPWMPIGFIAESYQVPADVLFKAAGIQPDQSVRRRLHRIARDTGIPYDQLVAQLMAAIMLERATSVPQP